MNLNVSDLRRYKRRQSSYIFPLEQQHISPAQVRLHVQETANNHVISMYEWPHLFLWIPLQDNQFVEEARQFILASLCKKSRHPWFQQQNHNYPRDNRLSFICLFVESNLFSFCFISFACLCLLAGVLLSTTETPLSVRAHSCKHTWVCNCITRTQVIGCLVLKNNTSCYVSLLIYAVPL